MVDLPICAWSKDAIPNLMACILEFVEKDGVIAFSIRRHQQKGTYTVERESDESVLLCENVDVAIGKLVKDSLVKAFYDHPRCRNDILETLSEEKLIGGKSVYLDIWYGCTCKRKDTQQSGA